MALQPTKHALHPRSGGGSHASVMVNHHRHNSLHDVILSADSVLPRKTESSEGSMHSRRYYYLYIMTNRSKTLYTGITSNLSKRVFQHKNGTFPGFMSRYRIDRLVYYERFVHVGDAMRREKQIKGLLRMKKIALIVSLNPEWKDLSEGWCDQYRPVTAARNA